MTAIGQATPEQLVARLRRIEGQVRGLQHMIERGDRCVDVLTQIAATRAALTAVGRHLVDGEVRRAVDAGADGSCDLVADVLVAVELLADR